MTLNSTDLAMMAKLPSLALASPSWLTDPHWPWPGYHSLQTLADLAWPSWLMANRPSLV
jgi:hypothetical protein